MAEPRSLATVTSTATDFRVRLTDKLELSWRLVNNSHVAMTVAFAGRAWHAVCINSKPSMLGSDCSVINMGFLSTAPQKVFQQVVLYGRSISQIVPMRPYIDRSTVFTETQLTPEGVTLQVTSWLRPLRPPESASGSKAIFLDRFSYLVFAHGDTDELFLGPHKRGAAGMLAANFADGSDLITTETQRREQLLLVHASLMLCGFAFLLPLAALIARYRDEFTNWTEQLPGACGWLSTHATLTLLGVLCGCLGVGCILPVMATGGHWTSFHHVAGIFCAALTVLQPLVASPQVLCPLRVPSVARATLRSLHRTTGAMLLVLAVPTMLHGMVLAQWSIAAIALLCFWLAVVASGLLTRECIKWRQQLQEDEKKSRSNSRSRSRSRSRSNRREGEASVASVAAAEVSVAQQRQQASNTTA